MTRPLRLIIYPDKAHQWRWRILAGNNRIIACSGEGFTRERDAKRSADLLLDGLGAHETSLERVPGNPVGWKSGE